MLPSNPAFMIWFPRVHSRRAFRSVLGAETHVPIAILVHERFTVPSDCLTRDLDLIGCRG